MATKKKSTTSKIIKQGKKMDKKNPKGFIALVIILVLLVGLGAAGYFVYINMFPKVVFALVGKEQVNVGVGAKYKEQGFKATYNGKDIHDEVKIEYYLNSELKSSVSTEEKVTYTAKYKLDYQKFSGELERKITITAVEAIDINFLELGIIQSTKARRAKLWILKLFSGE